jgi:hypothetical protein
VCDLGLSEEPHVSVVHSCLLLGIDLEVERRLPLGTGKDRERNELGFLGPAHPKEKGTIKLC